jgi:hypothetical protein
VPCYCTAARGDHAGISGSHSCTGLEEAQGEAFRKDALDWISLPAAHLQAMSADSFVRGPWSAGLPGVNKDGGRGLKGLASACASKEQDVILSLFAQVWYLFVDYH